MNGKTLSFAFILTTVFIQNRIVTMQRSIPVLPHKSDAVVIQGNGGESCPVQEMRDTAIADMRYKVNSLFLEQRNRTCECGYAGAGWWIVGFLNMTDSKQNCPGEWQLRSSPRRTCERRVERGCSLTAFSSHASYREVCGRIIGYQYGSTDALYGPIVSHTTPVTR